MKHEIRSVPSCSWILAAATSALAFGCAADVGSTAENHEIVDNLRQAGFPADDIKIVDGTVYVGREPRSRFLHRARCSRLAPLTRSNIAPTT